MKNICVHKGLPFGRRSYEHSQCSDIGVVAKRFPHVNFLVESMARGEASVVVPMAQMGFVVAALFGVIFLREPFNARKGAGIGAAVAALASLAHG